MRSRSLPVILPVLLTVLPAVAPACTRHEPRGGTVEPGRRFTLAIGDTARLRGTGLAVTLTDVRDDSRCPEDVDCAWAGNAVLVVTVEDGRSAPARHELHTNRPAASGSPSPSPSPYGRFRHLRVAGHQLRLLGLDPPRRSDERIDRGDYRARLAIHRA